MIVKTINYGIRAIVLLVGIMIMTGYFAPPGFDLTYRLIFGGIVIVFGIFRIITYYSYTKRHYQDDEDDDRPVITF